MLGRKKSTTHEGPAATLSSATAAAEAVVSNDDLLLQVLLRLPIRSLLKFKSVSKKWLSHISNPWFSRRRSFSHPLTPSGIFLRHPMFEFVDLSMNPSRTPLKSLGFTEPKHGVVILQSCNGLLLCSSNDGYYSNSTKDYYVYNPTTNQSTTLPKLQKKDGDGENNARTIIYGLTLAFDPTRSSTYKVVCVQNSDQFTNNYQIEIYSSDSSPWRPSRGLFAAPYTMRFDCGVYWNGAVHWISTWANCLYFDLREEKLHEMPMPRVPDNRGDRKVEYFGESGGHLHLIEIYEPDDLRFNVYQMQDDRSGWFVKYHIDLHCVSAAFPEMIPSEIDDLGFFNLSILAMIDQSEVDEESYLVLHVSRQVIRVNVKSGSFESLVDIVDYGESEAIPAIGFGDIDAYLYIESLAFV